MLLALDGSCSLSQTGQSKQNTSPRGRQGRREEGRKEGKEGGAKNRIRRPFSHIHKDAESLRTVLKATLQFSIEGGDIGGANEL